MRPIPPLALSALCVGWLLLQPGSPLAEDGAALLLTVAWCVLLPCVLARRFGVRKQSAPLYIALWAVFIPFWLLPRWPEPRPKFCGGPPPASVVSPEPLFVTIPDDPFATRDVPAPRFVSSGIWALPEDRMPPLTVEPLAKPPAPPTTPEPTAVAEPSGF